MKQSRQEFLKKIGAITLGACCGGILLTTGGCASIPSIMATRNENRLEINKSSMEEAGSLIVNHQSLKHPVFLHKITESEYSAVLMVCTHKNCELNPSGTILVCPCHGSEFSREGKVLEGPAESDLVKYKVTVEGDKLIIHV